MNPTIRRHKEIPLQQFGEGILLKILADEETGAKNIGMGWMTFKPGAQSSMHYRDTEEYIYIAKGEATIVFESGEKYVLNAGDTILIPSGSMHQHQNNSASDMEHIYIFAPQGPEKPFRDLPIVNDAN